MNLDQAISLSQAGDVDAYGTVVSETATLVRAYLALFVRDRDLINDLAQETFLFAFEHLKEYTLGTDFRAYLKSIARTQALKNFRARQRKDAAHGRYRVAVEGRLVEAAIGREEGSPLEGRLAQLKACIRRLTTRAQEFVRLRYFEGRSLQEIAGRQRTSVNQVSVTLFRVRQVLSECLGRSFSEGEGL